MLFFDVLKRELAIHGERFSAELIELPEAGLWMRLRMQVLPCFLRHFMWNTFLPLICEGKKKQNPRRETLLGNHR